MLHFIFHVILLVICMSVLDCINWKKKSVTGLKKMFNDFQRGDRA